MTRTGSPDPSIEKRTNTLLTSCPFPPETRVSQKGGRLLCRKRDYVSYASDEYIDDGVAAAGRERRDYAARRPQRDGERDAEEYTTIVFSVEKRARRDKIKVNN